MIVEPRFVPELRGTGCRHRWDREIALAAILAVEAGPPSTSLTDRSCPGLPRALRCRSPLLVLTCHHIICDGWSINMMIGDLPHSMKPAMSARDAVLPPAPSCVGHASSERDRASLSEATTDEAYWVDRFADLPRAARPAVRSVAPCDRDVPRRDTARGNQRRSVQSGSGRRRSERLHSLCHLAGRLPGADWPAFGSVGGCRRRAHRGAAAAGAIGAGRTLRQLPAYPWSLGSNDDPRRTYGGSAEGNGQRPRASALHPRYAGPPPCICRARRTGCR